MTTLYEHSPQGLFAFREEATNQETQTPNWQGDRCE